MNIKRKIAIAASALAAFTGIVLISNQANATDVIPAPSPMVSSQSIPAVTPSVTPSVDAPEAGNISDTAGDNVQSGDQTTPDVAGAISETDSATGSVDGDNVQSGDQTGPDTAGTTDAESNN
jgi:hypothetical protein